MKPIEVMRSLFGITDGCKCGDCSHLEKHTYNRVYYKCDVFGASSCASSDFRLKWTACGLYNKEYHGGKIKDYAKHMFKEKEIEQIDGQLSLFDGETQ